jgi:hypothetical protein
MTLGSLLYGLNEKDTAGNGKGAPKTTVGNVGCGIGAGAGDASLQFYALFRTCVPYVEFAVIGHRLNVETIRRCGAVHGRTKVRQTNPSYVGERNLKGRTRFQRRQLVHNTLNQRMVLSVPARLQVRDVDLPVLRDRPVTLLLFGSHDKFPLFARQNTKTKYLCQVYFCS